MPIENSLVTLYSVGKYRSDPFKITEVVTPKNGLVKLQLDFSNIEILKVVVQNHNVETLYYPEIKYLNPPKWWQDHDLVLNIKLSSWKLKHQAINNKFIQQEMPLIPIFDFPEIPLTDSISIDQMEATLLPDHPKEILSFSSKMQSNLNKNVHEYKKFNNESYKTIVNHKNVLFEEALNLATKIAANPGGVLRMTKRLLREGERSTLDSLLEISAGYQAIAHMTPDHHEAVNAFIEKRPPKFS